MLCGFRITVATGILLLFFTILGLIHSPRTSPYLYASPPTDPETTYLPHPPTYKLGPVTENFPSLLLSSDARPPPILAANAPAKDTIRTPLFIGFTRNWPILQQCVASFLAAGWPAKDIYVIDNTGTMDANQRGQLSLQNPFFLNHTRLTKQLGVNVLATPTLLSFAQLQNYMLWHAIMSGWEVYWWSHMDTVAVSFESHTPYKSLHQRIVDDYATVKNDEKVGNEHAKWGVRFYNYDKLALVNVDAYRAVGGWDTHIPFYHSDCDMYARLRMHGFSTPSYPNSVGHTFDVGGTLPDLSSFYPLSPSDSPGGAQYKKLIKTLRAMERYKDSGDGEFRNFWQKQQTGGEGEPWWKNPQGFEKATLMWIEQGRRVFAEKWGHKDCNIVVGAKRKEGDAWRVKKDFWVGP